MPGRKTGVFVATLVAAAALGGGTALAAPYVASASVAVSSNSPTPGETIAVAVAGYTPGEQVVGYLDSTWVWGAPVDASGGAGLMWTVPASTTCGAHTLTAKGSSSGLQSHAVITVVAPCNGTDQGAGSNG
jgi:hypothetical protein